MKPKLSAGLSIVMLLFAWAGPSFAAPDPAAAKSFVQVGINDAFEVLRDGSLSQPEKTEKLRVLLREYFDVPTVGKFALGVYRRQANDAQMQAYLDAFEEYLVQVYINRIVTYTPERDEKAGDILKINGTRPATETDLFVLSTLDRKGARPEPIEWRVRESGGRLAVVDVTVQGTSQALTYKQEFASIIQRRGNGIDGLIAELRKKNARFRADSGNSESARAN